MSKINYKFLLLQTIAIILVVVGHQGGISLFSDWFPIYSFHMPLFIFISGYFYNCRYEDNIKEYILKKFKRLIIPCLIWNLIYGLVVNILRYWGIILYGEILSFRSLFIEPWITGHQFGLNVSTWFVPALFIVQISYIIIRKLLKVIKLDNEYFIIALFMIIGCTGIILANKGYTWDRYLILVRTMFLIPFYQMGYLYKIKLENSYKINTVIYFIGLFILQFIILKKYNNLNFGVAFCLDFNRENIILPYITSITGIMFWIKICEILSDSLSKSKVINYIGKNTWTIMMHHQFIFFFINVMFSLASNTFRLEGFEYEKFRTNAWYAYNAGDNRFLIFYVIAGIAIPLIIKYQIDRLLDIHIFNKLKNKFLKTDKTT